MAHRCAECPYRALASARVAPTRVSSRRSASARAWRRTAATSARADSGGNADATARSRREKPPPWALMGRSVHEHHVGLSREQEDELALGAVADEAGVSLESLRSNLERLERLCPPLVARRERGEVKPARLARLALDLDAVASRMMRLKLLLPNADVAEMCARKPALLEAGAVDRAEAVAAIVRTEYPARFVADDVARGDEDVFAEDDDSALQKTHHDDDSKTNESETKAAMDDTNKKANALLASVPDILLEPSDECVREMVTRARALRFLLPTADVARIAKKKPSFVLTRDAGHASARGGHAAGLETGRSYEEGVPKQEKKNTKKTKSKSVDDSRDDSSVSESGGVHNDAEVQTNVNREEDSWFDSWHVAISAREVRARMPEDCDVDRLLTDHPNILAMDVPALFEDLRAVFPTRNPADVLRTNPKIAYQVRRRSATRNFFFALASLFSEPRRREDVVCPFCRREKNGVQKVVSCFGTLTKRAFCSSRNRPRSWKRTRRPRGLCASLDRDAGASGGNERETRAATPTANLFFFFSSSLSAVRAEHRERGADGSRREHHAGVRGERGAHDHRGAQGARRGEETRATSARGVERRRMIFDSKMS